MNGAGGTTASSLLPGLATITAPLSSSGVNLAETQGIPFNAVVAKFSDTTGSPTTLASDFTATINWGDGTSPTAGLVSPDPGGGFDVIGSHTYATTGLFPTSISIFETNTPASPQTTARGLANVKAPAPPLTAVPQLIPATAGTPLASTTLVGAFDDNLLPTTGTTTPPAFVAVISWGDGHTTQTMASIVPGTNLYDVTAGNTYALPGTYKVAVTVQDQAGHSATINSVAVVVPATPSATGSATGRTFGVTPGVAFSGVVASFTDPNSLANSGDIAVTITWGDGTQSLGTVAGPDTNGLYTVTGSHTYAAGPSPPTFAVTVAIADPIGPVATTTSTAVVTTGAITFVGFPFTVAPGTAFTGTVATFTATNPIAASLTPTATINWGDGTTSPGAVTGPDAHGLFTVAGTHVYFALPRRRGRTTSR